jgi:hypothetical protein
MLVHHSLERASDRQICLDRQSSVGGELIADGRERGPRMRVGAPPIGTLRQNHDRCGLNRDQQQVRAGGSRDRRAEGSGVPARGPIPVDGHRDVLDPTARCGRGVGRRDDWIMNRVR